MGLVVREHSPERPKDPCHSYRDPPKGTPNFGKIPFLVSLYTKWMLTRGRNSALLLRNSN